MCTFKQKKSSFLNADYKHLDIESHHSETWFFNSGCAFLDVIIKAFGIYFHHVCFSHKISNKKLLKIFDQPDKILFRQSSECMSNVPSNFCVVAPLGLAVFGLFHASESVALG